MNAPTPRALRRYAGKCLGLERYLRQPGDGRPQPRIPARALLWAMLIVRLLREISFHAVEQLVHSGCRAWACRKPLATTPWATSPSGWTRR